MLDFLIISEERNNKGIRIIFPSFRTYPKSKDLMTKGRDFYAVWVEDRGLWSTDESDALELIDRELEKYVEEHKNSYDMPFKVMYMRDSKSKMIDSWHTYVKNQLRDSYHVLDEKVMFSNSEVKKTDYATRTLPYPLEEGDISAYDKLMSRLYSPEERHKIEWAIGAIISGDSKKIQKFVVLYGDKGTGKSTVLHIIEKLFEGYDSVFDSKTLGSNTDPFALAAFADNPLVAIQHDGDLSRIEDNTKLNSLTAHEKMFVNEKFKSPYTMTFNTFLFMGTNKPVRITDSKSGIIRRLIDVQPTGNTFPLKEYNAIKREIPFELGGIASHCLKVYESNQDAYEQYIPLCMLGATNDFYNFMEDNYFLFSKPEGVTQAFAWEKYNEYVKEARVQYPLPLRIFKEELRTYFDTYEDRATVDGARVRKLYSGFKKDKFSSRTNLDIEEPEPAPSWLSLTKTVSLLDKELADCQAQYASGVGTPIAKWSKITTHLKDLDTTKTHYVRPPDQHIVIDFDLKDKDGNKSKELNLKEASKWPSTYAEFSKSGEGVHLHYIYDGDVSELSCIYDEDIEIKVFTGNSSLRRRLSFCNDIPIRTINSGLPKKEKKKMTTFEGFESEKALYTHIVRNLNKEIAPSTKSSIDYIYNALENAYSKGLKYDLSGLKTKVYVFALNSTHQKDYCLKLYSKMHFKSEEPSESIDIQNERPYVFFDVEIVPNLFLLVWKYHHEKTKNYLFNPTPEQLDQLFTEKLIGFNCRRYDNHVMWAAKLGYSNAELYALSKRIISGDKGAFFGEAYNLSYTDVYDFAATKQSLKKWEIELGIHHQELGYSWDEPIPEDQWYKVAEYCGNDVDAEEAVFDHLAADWQARQILAKVTGGSVNDTTNSLSARFIFGKDKHPQDQFNYRNLGEISQIDDKKTREMIDEFESRTGFKLDREFTKFDANGRPIFPGYSYSFGKSIYRGEEIGEGGRVMANPGIYYDVALDDIASMHPSSAIDEELFGPVYTKRFKELKDTRVLIKHGYYEEAKKVLDGALKPFLEEVGFDAKALAYALKIVINAVYGLTAAKFDNAFKDVRNIDNIVAKRGALFMENLRHEVESRGFTVAHIKTDSIKVPNATNDILMFIEEYGHLYGYDFEHEATYDRMCLVNDAVYIAKYATIERCRELYGDLYVDSLKGVLKDNREDPGAWTATGAQFQVPYVFKTLFSHEEIEFKDMCETKAVSTALYLRKEGSDPEFIGKVGLFCPVKKEFGGKELLREGQDKEGNKKYDSATGAKGYLWLESEYVGKMKDPMDIIDKSYYNSLVDDAKAAISKYGDFEAFVSDDDDDDVPWDVSKVNEHKEKEKEINYERSA